MLNLLSNAISSIQGLIKNESILIENKQIENDEGFSVENTYQINTFAHLQPLNPFEISKLTNGTLDSPYMLKFYIIGDLASVLNSINKTDCVIKWKDKAFKVFSKEDWSLNGWIKVIGIEISEVYNDV